MNPKIFVVDVQTTLARWAEKSIKNGITIIRVGMDPEQRKQIGNYKPFILSSPDKNALYLSRGYAAHFETTVEISYSLQKDCAEFEDPEMVRSVWESLDQKIRNKYKVVIFFPHP